MHFVWINGPYAEALATTTTRTVSPAPTAAAATPIAAAAARSGGSGAAARRTARAPCACRWFGMRGLRSTCCGRFAVRRIGVLVREPRAGGGASHERCSSPRPNHRDSSRSDG